MIKFFRHIRKSLLKENKTSKYFKYAIGEIILVVIGILIALQINNWNELRKDKNQEKAILYNINSEFNQNSKALEKAIIINNQSFNSGIKLMGLIGKSKKEVLSNNIDSLLFKLVYFNKFNPSESAILDLLQSGRLQLLNNEDLKGYLYSWSRVMTEIMESYDGFDSKIEDDLLPYLTKNYSLKDMDRYGNLNWKKPSVLKINKVQIFDEIEFENLIDDALYRLKVYNTSLSKANLIINHILNETKLNN